MNSEGMKDLLGDIVRSIAQFNAQRLVIDSVSAILQTVGYDETRTFLQTIFGRITKSRRITSLLIGEIPYGNNHTGFGMEEFVADGIITLGRSQDDFRTLTVRKMRATRVYETNRFFTLDNGFQVLQHQPWRPTIKKPVAWMPIHDDNTPFSTGSMDLDTLLGGYPKGGYIVLEVEANVPIDAIRLFELPLAWNFISQGRGVLFVPALGADSEEIRQLMTQHVDHEAFIRQVRVFEHSREGKDQISPVVIARGASDKATENIEKLLTEATLKLNQETGQPVVRIMGLPALEVLYAGHIDLLFKQVGEVIAQNRSLGNLTLAITRSGQEITSKILDIVDWHIRLIERNGQIFMREVKPKPTPYVALETEIYNGNPKLKLISLV